MVKGSIKGSFDNTGPKKIANTIEMNKKVAITIEYAFPRVIWGIEIPYSVWPEIIRIPEKNPNVKVVKHIKRLLYVIKENKSINNENEQPNIDMIIKFRRWEGYKSI